jgi:16S rRNA processing protein RimM
LERGIFLSKAKFMTDQKNYLVKDLVGCEVVTEAGEALGTFRDIIATGANDIYVVGEGPAEILVPAIKSVVLSIDVEKRRIVVDLPKGLRPEERPGWPGARKQK